MAQCPVCQSTIADEFGLVECGHCGAQLIMHMDGQIEHSGNPPHSDAEVNFSHDADSEPPVSAPPDELFGVEEVLGAEGEPVEEPVEQPMEGPLEEPLALDPAESDPLQAPDAPDSEVYRAAASPDLSDIAEFGNSDVSSGREGNLRYNLTVSGIDTADVREAFREALTDRKFLWDADQILRSVRNGEVDITNVTAIKAYVLIGRLRSLPVRVRWEQYAIQQA